MRVAPVLFKSVMVAAGVGAAFRAGRRYRRWAIRGSSMYPGLREGDWVLVDMRAYERALPRRGEIVIASDPRERSHAIVKRVAGVDLHGLVDLRGDNPFESTDSRTFGPVPRQLLKGRVRWRYWPLSSAGSVV